MAPATDIAKPTATPPILVDPCPALNQHVAHLIDALGRHQEARLPTCPCLGTADAASTNARGCSEIESKVPRSLRQESYSDAGLCRMRSP